MKSIDCPLQTNARVLPDQPAVLCGAEILTNKELNRRVWLTADYLRELGVSPGDRVALFSPNSAEYLTALYALWRLGAVPCLMSTRLPEERLDGQIRQAGARYLITPLENILTSPEVRAKKINLTQTMEQIRPLREEAERQVVSFGLEAPASVIFTSGSQGAPKAVLHSFGNHFFSAKGANGHIPFDTNHRWLLSLPLYHVGGLSIFFRALLGKGGIVLPEPGEMLSATIRRHRVTHLSMVATQLFRVLNRPDDIPALQTCRALLLGGSPIPESLISLAIAHQLPIYTSYGLTEMASQVATTPRIRRVEGAEAAKILPYREVKIGDKKEILVRGKTLFQGYVDGARLERPFGPDGWFATGDIGELGAGNTLRISGRKDNMFISGGENIRPEEIERFLCGMDAVEQAIVVPVRHEEFGFRPVAFIKERSDLRVKKEDIISSLRSRLPKFMTPDAFYAWPTQIDENSIKISRDRLRKLLQDNNPDLTLLE
jgi:O-succinylbenzoic acid--CoA ligase